MPVLLSKHGNGTSIMYTEDICRYLMISVDDFRCLPKDFGHFTASSASHLCRRVILDVSVIIWWVPSGWSLRISVAGTVPRGDFSWFPPFRSLHFPSQIFMFSIRTLRTCLCCHVRNLFIWFGDSVGSQAGDQPFALKTMGFSVGSSCIFVGCLGTLEDHNDGSFRIFWDNLNRRKPTRLWWRVGTKKQIWWTAEMTKTYQNLTEQFTYVKPGTCSNNEGVHCKKKQTTDGLLGNGIIMFPYISNLCWIQCLHFNLFEPLPQWRCSRNYMFNFCE